jgi:hypothetical protein
VSVKPTSSAEAKAKAVAAGRSSGFAWLVRAGFVARGLVYGVIGALALALALGAGSGAATNQQGALALIAGAPLGGVALAALAVALLAYVVWQIGQAILGRSLERGEAAKTTDRIGNLASGIGYLALFVIAVKVLLGDDQQSSPHRAAAGVLGWPGGQTKTEEMSPDLRRFLDLLGRVGLVSRALVFSLIGYFLIRTAIDYDPSKAIGIDGALREVARQPYGSWLLGVVAVGLMVFAAASLAEARYRRL